jgi:hypothetical protein
MTDNPRPFPWDDPFQVSLLRIPCPRCGAPTGQPCDMRIRTRWVHLSRADQAVRSRGVMRTEAETPPGSIP